MRFLIDQNRSPQLAGLLREAGHDAVHTLELGLERAEDGELLALADTQDQSAIVLLYLDDVAEDLRHGASSW